MNSVKPLFNSYLWSAPAAAPDCPRAATASNLPAEYDFRAAYPKCVPRIRTQDEKTPAHLLVSASLVSDVLCKATGGNTRPELSVDHLKSCIPVNATAESTGFIVDSLNFVKTHDVPLAECLNAEQCSAKCDRKVAAGTIASMCKVSGEAAIKEAILKNGPVAAEVGLKSDFTSYRSGVYQYKKVPVIYNITGGHVVKIIGWGVKDGKKYWKIENTWGEDWGEHGFGNVEMGSAGVISEESVLGVVVNANK